MLTKGTFLQSRYCIARKIGGGGMGVVYLAEDTRLPGRRCAIKEMLPDQMPAQDRNWAITVFQHEAQMLARLTHIGLTAVTDFFSEAGNWYLVMDYVEGETLEARLQRTPGGQVPLSEVLDIARQLCDVLEYLHAQNPPVIFRDLKPANVMRTPQGQVKLIDFGIARFFKPGRTRDTVNLGTPGYAAPEQYGRQGQSGPRTDIYSLGVLLHELLTGYDPTLTPLNLPPARTLNVSMPQHIETVILQATHIAPDARFQTVPELRQALFAPVPAPQRRVVPRYAVVGAAVFFVLLVGGIMAVAFAHSSVIPAGTPTLVAILPADTPPSPVVASTAASTASVPMPTRTPTRQPSPTPAPIPATPTFALESGRISYMSNRDGNWEIYVNEAGKDRRLTRNDATDGWASFSPDGTLMAFVSRRDGPWNLYTMRADGSDVRRLTNDPAEDYIPIWSPDGSRLLFFSNRDGNFEIYVMNADGSNMRRLTYDPAQDWAPVWSPDGREIAFMSDRSGNWDIYVMNGDGSGVRQLTSDPGEDWSPDYSPDGKRIVFTSNRDGDHEIYIMNADGSNVRQQTFNTSSEKDPAWSPDGKYIAFYSDLDGDNEIYVLDLETGAIRKITDNAADEMYPFWDPSYLPRP